MFRYHSLAFSLDDPHHEADDDKKQDRTPYPTVAPHPASARHTTIHHVAVCAKELPVANRDTVPIAIERKFFMSFSKRLFTII